MAIDRMPSLIESSFFEQITYLSQYPFEFTISKALKHLSVVYETHQVYLALGFILALLLAFFILSESKNIYIKTVLFLIILVLLLAIIYCQSNTAIVTLVFCAILFPFLVIKNKRFKIIPISILTILLVGGLFFGWFKSYYNKNTMANINLIEAIVTGDNIKENIDKRFYIYSCSTSLIKSSVLFGYGVGDVQLLLNACYEERDYLVAEFNSIGSDINTHNYYLHMTIAAGLFGFMSISLFFYKIFSLAYKSKNYFYAIFLTVFVIGLLTENLLLRMLGVFPFAIINSLFFSHCKFLNNE